MKKSRQSLKQQGQIGSFYYNAIKDKVAPVVQS